jgi:hypothetical protein
MLLGGSINADASAIAARELWDYTQNQMPQEKAQMVRDMDQTAKELKERGSDWADGRGQAIASIPPRIYMRWHQQYPGCWKDKQFVAEFLKDNPQCCAPGYRPRPSGLRHGFTFSAGKAIYHKYKANMSVIS